MNFTSQPQPGRGQGQGARPRGGKSGGKAFLSRGATGERAQGAGSLSPFEAPGTEGPGGHSQTFPTACGSAQGLGWPGHPAHRKRGALSVSRHVPCLRVLTPVRSHTYQHVCVPVHPHVSTRVHICPFIHMCLWVPVCAHTCASVCLCAHVCVHTCLSAPLCMAQGPGHTAGSCGCQGGSPSGSLAVLPKARLRVPFCLGTVLGPADFCVAQPRVGPGSLQGGHRVLPVCVSCLCVGSPLGLDLTTQEPMFRGWRAAGGRHLAPTPREQRAQAQGQEPVRWFETRPGLRQSSSAGTCVRGAPRAPGSLGPSRDLGGRGQSFQKEHA